MGERAYFINKEGEKYSYLYSHWGAGWLWQYIAKKVLNHEKASIEDFINKMKEEAENGEEIQYINEPNDIIDFHEIWIEAYIIIDKEANTIKLVIPIISNYVNGGIEREFDLSNELATLLIWRFLEIANRINILANYEEWRNTEPEEASQNIMDFAIHQYELSFNEIRVFPAKVLRRV